LYTEDIKLNICGEQKKQPEHLKGRKPLEHRGNHVGAEASKEHIQEHLRGVRLPLHSAIDRLLMA
jgi:hypothetical protein